VSGAMLVTLRFQRGAGGDENGKHGTSNSGTHAGLFRMGGRMHVWPDAWSRAKNIVS